MSLYGFNRSALNGGISTIVAGAALVIAVSGFVAESVRTVYPAAPITAVSTTQADGVRFAMGDGGFVVTSSGTAWPALLLLQSAEIVVTSVLQATYTDVWGYALGALTGEGFITRPGTGVSTAVSTGSATALLTAGASSQLVAMSGVYADASVKLNGQSTTQRDGYVQQIDVSSDTTANGLRTALGYVTATTTSYCTTDSIKTHGGEARMDSAFVVAAIASTDTAYFESNSDMTAHGLVTSNSAAFAATGASLTVWPTRTTFAVQVDLTGVAFITANARTALLGLVGITGSSESVATGTIYKMGEATITGSSTVTSLGANLVLSTANITATSVATAHGYTNAEAPDPIERTMYRTASDRIMYRPFTDREMRRAV